MDTSIKNDPVYKGMLETTDFSEEIKQTGVGESKEELINESASRKERLNGQLNQIINQ